MLRITLLACVCCALISASLGLGRADDGADSKAAIARSLDAFHKAAADADFDAYFARFAPDAVFLGTDASERWNVEEFKAYAKPFFDKGQGWTYSAIEGKRFIAIADDGRTAWFDELLSNAKYGTCRGSGVMQRMGGGDDWRIAQYNLAFMVPNEAAEDVMAAIRAKGS